MKLFALKWVFPAILAFAISLSGCIPNPPLPPCYDGDFSGEDSWSDIYPGGDTTVPYLPDVYSNYWATGINISELENVGLRIHGKTILKFQCIRWKRRNCFIGNTGQKYPGKLQ